MSNSLLLPRRHPLGAMSAAVVLHHLRTQAASPGKSAVYFRLDLNSNAGHRLRRYPLGLSLLRAQTGNGNAIISAVVRA